MLDQQYFGASQYLPYLNKHFILVRAVNDEEAGEKLYEQYKVRGTPTVLIAKPDGSEIDRVVGFGDADRFQEDLDEAFQGENNFINLLAKNKKNSDDLLTAFLLARKYDSRYDNEMSEKAVDLYERVLKKADEAKTIAVPPSVSKEEVSLYEHAKFDLAQAKWYMNLVNARERQPIELIEFTKEFPKSPLMKQAYGALFNYYLRYAPADEAKSFFEDILEKYPEEPDLLFYYVRYCKQKNTDLDRGAEAAEKMVELSHRSIPYYVRQYAEILAAKGDTTKLYKEYGNNYINGKIRDLLSDLSYYATFWLQRGENLENALEMIQIAMKNDPENSDYKSCAAAIYLKMGKEEEALAIFGPAFIQDRMDKSRDLYAYANFWAREEKNLESALVVAKKAVELSSQPYIWSALASVHWKLKNYEEAKKALEEAVDLQPSTKYYRDQLKKLKEEMEKAKK